MKYDRLTKRTDNGVDITKCVDCDIQNNCDFTQNNCYNELKDRLAELEDKIENGTLVEIGEVAKLFNKLWECPCDYILDDEDVNGVICKNVGEDWCNKNCDTEDFSKCWEQYLKVKLKELKGEV